MRHIEVIVFGDGSDSIFIYVINALLRATVSASTKISEIVLKL